MGKWAKVARIVKPRKREGSLVVQSIDGLPFLLDEGMRVWFVPPKLTGPRTAQVEAARPLSERAWEVSFDAVANPEDAEGLAGSYCLVLKDDLPHGMSDRAPVGLVGWRVHDRRWGDMGLVSDVIVHPAQSLLEVTGPGGKVLVPLVDAFICSIDEEARLIEVDVPDGLVELGRDAAAPDAQDD